MSGGDEMLYLCCLTCPANLCFTVLCRTVLLPAGLVGPASDVTVLLSGVSGELAAQLTKRLSAKGVEHERILFCDYF